MRVGLKSGLGIVAFAAMGCSGGGANNTLVAVDTHAPVVSNNTPAPLNNTPVAGNNTPVPSNNAPVAANNTPAPANNAPIDPQKHKKTKPGPDIPDPASSGKDGWAKSQTDAKKLTTSIDAKMKSMKNYQMVLDQYADTPGGSGEAHPITNIADQSRYLIRYADYQVKPFAHFESFIVTKQAGQKKYSTLIGDKYQEGRVDPGTDIAGGWLFNSSHFITNGIGTDHKPFTELVTAIQHAKWAIHVETKKFSTGSFQRIIMESNSTPKKRYEIVVDPKNMLPVSFSAVVFEKRKLSNMVQISWAKSDKPLTDDDLKPAENIEKVNVISPEEAKKRGLKPNKG